VIDDANGLLQRAAMWLVLAWATAVSVKLYFLTRAPK